MWSFISTNYEVELKIPLLEIFPWNTLPFPIFDLLTCLFLSLGKPSKKKCTDKDIVLKGGRGSIQKPNYKNKDILVGREGVKAKRS